MLISVCMSETQNSQPFNPDQSAQTGHILQQQYDNLVTNWMNAGRPDGTSYGSDRRELQGLMASQTETILTGTGVELSAADLLDQERTPEGRLKVAVGVAEEASTLGFTLEGDEQAAKEQARR